MAVTAELADGRRLEFPDGTDPSVVQATVKRMISAAPKAPAEEAKPATPTERSTPRELMRQVGLTARHGMEGIGGLLSIPSEAIDAVTGIVDKTRVLPVVLPKFRSNEAISNLADVIGLPKPENATERVAGAIAQSMAGTGGVAGAAKNLTGAIPKILSSNMGTQAMSAAGAGAGGGIAAENDASPIGQIVASLVGGIAAPASVGAAKMAGNKAMDLRSVLGASMGNKASIDRLASDAISRAAGDSKGKIVAAMMNHPTEYVAGAKPTVAEAIAEAQMGRPEQFGGGIVKLQKDLTGAKGIEDILPSVEKQQKVAMLDPLQKLAGGATIAEQEAAQGVATKARAASSGTQYEALAPTPVKADSTLLTLLDSPTGKSAVTMARKIALDDAAAREVKGLPPIEFEKTDVFGKKTYTAQGLQYIKSAMDSIASSPTLRDQLGIAGSGQVKVIGVRNELVDWMNKAIPGWEKARTDYASESVPMDRLKVAQALLQKMQNAKGNITDTPFLAGTGRGEDSMLRKLGGVPRDSTIETVFEPADAAKIRGIESNMARNAEVDRIAGSVKGSNAGNLAGDDVPHIPNLLSRPAMIINFALKGISGGANTPVAKRIAEAAKDPQEFAKLLLRNDKVGITAKEVAKRAAVAAAIQQNQGAQ